LKKRTKKLCEFGFGVSWRTEAEISKVFCFFFFKKEPLSAACPAWRWTIQPTWAATFSSQKKAVLSGLA
jgi:hypothetical protein